MRNICNILIMFTLILATSCGKRKAPAADSADSSRIDTTALMVMQIQKCSRIYTTEYRVHKIITHDDQLAMKGRLAGHDYNISLPLGKRKIAIPVDATIKAYVDFGGFSAANVRRDSTHIEIVLPDPRIVLTSSRIDHNGIREYVALTRRNFSDEELASYEQQGRKAIIADIAKTDIIESARAGAANVLVPMLVQTGFKPENITISFAHDYAPRDIMRLMDNTTGENRTNSLKPTR